MSIQDLADTILNLLYEYFTEHNAIDPMSEADIVSFINKEESDIKGNYIDAALEYLINSEQITKRKRAEALSLYKITPAGVDAVEKKNQQQQSHDRDQPSIINIYNGKIHIHNRGNHSPIVPSSGHHSYYESTEKVIPKYFDTANEVITSTRKMLQMYIADKTITPEVIEEVDSRVDIMEKLMYLEE